MIRLLGLLPGLLAAVAAGAAPALRVTNYTDGEIVRHPVPLLRGELADTAANAVTVVNTASSRGTRELKGPAAKGRFKALTELVPGPNRLRIRAGTAVGSLTLHYKPQTNPRIVRVFYLVDRDGNTAYQTPLPGDPQTWREKLATAMLLQQTFTAERMHERGYGRRTFNLEFDAEGRVVVRLLRGDRTTAEYHKVPGGDLWGHSARLIAKQAPNPHAKDLVVCAFTRLDPATGTLYCHSALGGGNLAFFGGGDLFSWPDRLADVPAAFLDARKVDPKQVFSDSVGRHTFWANASTTIGACLHELGHTFGLPHTRERHDIMTRGIDRFNRFFTFADPPHAGRPTPYAFRPDEEADWPDVSAAALAAIPHFDLDARPRADGPRTSVRLDAPGRRVVVRSDDGLRFIGLHVGGDCVGLVPIPPAETPTEVSVPTHELARRLKTDVFRIRAIDALGRTTWAPMETLLGGPYVRAWRFARETVPWSDAGAHPAVDDAKRRAIETSAATRDLTRAPGAYVDFLRVFPPTGRPASPATRSGRSAWTPPARSGSSPAAMTRSGSGSTGAPSSGSSPCAGPGPTTSRPRRGCAPAGTSCSSRSPRPRAGGDSTSGWRTAGGTGSTWRTTAGWSRRVGRSTASGWISAARS